MITMKEILGSTKLDTLPINTQHNLNVLFHKINEVRALFKQPMTVTSGFRSIDDHLRIYKQKGITDVAKIPMKSKHLSGEAIDIADPEHKLQAWCLNNEEDLADIGLWCEDFSATKNWVHFQTCPPKSGKRFFLP